MIKLIAFDMDGTLTASRQQISVEMLETLFNLYSRGMDIAIFSGGTIDLIREQMKDTFSIPGVYYFPCSGSQFYKDGKKVYDYKIPWTDKRDIFNIINNLILQKNLKAITSKEDQVEDRGSQITFSVLGRNAPNKAKYKYDPDRKKRIGFVKSMDYFLKITGMSEKYDVVIGGTTSIDFIPKNRSKGIALRELVSMLRLEDDEVIYFGDKLMKGGNDYSVKETGIRCVQVDDEKDCLRRLRKL